MNRCFKGMSRMLSGSFQEKKLLLVANGDAGIHN